MPHTNTQNCRIWFRGIPRPKSMAYTRPKNTEQEVGLAGKSRWTFLLFCVFGGGTSWYATSLAGMALPMYQQAGLGLSLANNMEIGYNLGTLPWLLLLLCRVPSSNDVQRIWALLATQAVAISILCVATPGSPLFSPLTLLIAMFFGGSCGYGAQFVCVPYLLRYENRLVAAFWLGDSVTSVGCAVAAVLWRGFGWDIRSYMIVCGPVVVAVSAVALWFIESTESSIYRSDDVFQAVPTEDTEHRAISARARQCSPEYVRSPLTLKLAFIVFWSQFADCTSRFALSSLCPTILHFSSLASQGVSAILSFRTHALESEADVDKSSFVNCGALSSRSQLSSQGRRLRPLSNSTLLLSFRGPLSSIPSCSPCFAPLPFATLDSATKALSSSSPCCAFLVRTFATSSRGLSNPTIPQSSMIVSLHTLLPSLSLAIYLARSSSRSSSRQKFLHTECAK